MFKSAKEKLDSLGHRLTDFSRISLSNALFSLLNPLKYRCSSTESEYIMKYTLTPRPGLELR